MDQIYLPHSKINLNDLVELYDKVHESQRNQQLYVVPLLDES